MEACTSCVAIAAPARFVALACALERGQALRGGPANGAVLDGNRRPRLLTVSATPNACASTPGVDSPATIACALEEAASGLKLFARVKAKPGSPSGAAQQELARKQVAGVADELASMLLGVAREARALGQPASRETVQRLAERCGRPARPRRAASQAEAAEARAKWMDSALAKGARGARRWTNREHATRLGTRAEVEGQLISDCQRVAAWRATAWAALWRGPDGTRGRA